MKTHTPGPWTVASHTDTYGAYIVQEAATAQESGDDSADQANARLIAAAPDLLNACHAALSQLTEDREEYLQADIDQLRAAIAKATKQ